jgi:hypothetical protein
MPKIVHLHMGMFDPPDRLAALSDVAAIHELVLFGARHLMIDSRLAVLRQALAPRRMVALLIDDYLPGIERALVDDLLNDGVIPLIVAAGAKPASSSMVWPEDDDPPAPGSDHPRRDGRCVKGPTLQPRRRRRPPPRDDTGELRPAA